MENIIYDVWLSQALQYGSPKIKAIKELYGSISDFYKGGEYEWRLCGQLSSNDILRLKNESLSDAEKNVNLAYKSGYKITALFDADYPKLLEEIFNPPGVLYVNGDISVLNSLISVAIVGTRKASDFGRKSAYEISRGLSSAGVVIVSGGAVGIDSAAHKGALSGGGRTILVLGCGIDYPYLMYNKSMRDDISKSGAVISEFPPNYPGNKYTFPIRNRIISGLSKSVLVIEAGEKSGSLITANYACEHNRDVFVKYNVMYPLPKGSRLLINDGAKIVETAEDVLSEYSISAEIDFKPNTDIKAENIEVPEYLRAIYNEIEKGKIHIDVLSERVKLPVFKLLPMLTELELLGFIKAETGRIYSVN